VALRLARHALDSVVRTGRLPEVKPAELPVALLARRACFVTLTKHGQLRGCIGHLTAQMPLYQAIMENARAAALQDYRFEPVRPSELPEIDIEISVLTPPRPLQYKSPEELLQRLRPGIDGVILELGPCSATFLPQVWEKLPSKEQFLDQLCLKAGCWPGDWRRPSVSVSTYQVEAFAEDDRPAVDGPVVAPQP
jgi:AmmeMemoRadiSam system protein A